MKSNIMIIHSGDNVAVALTAIPAGEAAAAEGVDPFPVLDQIPASHKVALRDIGAGEEVLKYGEVIAVSARAIQKGEWVHTHNLETGRVRK